MGALAPVSRTGVLMLVVMVLVLVWLKRDAVRHLWPAAHPGASARCTWFSRARSAASPQRFSRRAESSLSSSRNREAMGAVGWRTSGPPSVSGRMSRCLAWGTEPGS